MLGGVIGTDAYVRARKLGLKSYHNSLQKRLNTSLPVLEEIAPQLNTLGRNLPASGPRCAKAWWSRA